MTFSFFLFWRAEAGEENPSVLVLSTKINLEWSLNEEFLEYIGLWLCLGGGLSQLLVGVKGLSLPWVSLLHRQVVLDCMEDLAKHKPKSEPASSIPLRFLLQASALSSCPNFVNGGLPPISSTFPSL